MAASNSNSASDSVKVALFWYDIHEKSKISRSDSVTVQSYAYTLNRSVNTGKVTENLEKSCSFSLVVRIGTGDNMKLYYECIRNRFPSTFTLVFNAVYDSFGYLSGNDGEMVISGYVVALDVISSRESEISSEGKMTLEMKILVGTIEYVGVNSNISHTF